MIPNPILKVLSTVRNSNARSLLMGGQACVFYGGAEFSRDIDLAISIEPDDIRSIEAMLANLQAEQIFVPSLDPSILKKGHACHFRCGRNDVEGVRIDLMHRMRGCPEFDSLWEDRTIVEIPGVGPIPVLSLPYLVLAKKTQRSKDWPMIRRLLESDILVNPDQPSEKQVRFWLLECRTPGLLVELAKSFRDQASNLVSERFLLRYALEGRILELEKELAREEDLEKELDKKYWEPLKTELAEMKRNRTKGGSGENEAQSNEIHP